MSKKVAKETREKTSTCWWRGYRNANVIELQKISDDSTLSTLAPVSFMLFSLPSLATPSSTLFALPPLPTLSCTLLGLPLLPTLTSTLFSLDLPPLPTLNPTLFNLPPLLALRLLLPMIPQRRRTGPASLATTIHPRPVKLLRLSIPSTPGNILDSRCAQDVLLQRLDEMVREQKEVGLRRIQYPREYKLGAISFWREESKQGHSKYAVARSLKISEKMLSDWIAKEEKILNMRKGQRKDSKGRTATLPEMENYLHMEFLNLRQNGVRLSRAWFIAEGKKWSVSPPSIFFTY